MAKLGSEKRPLRLRLQTPDRFEEIAEICDENDWHFILGIEPDKSEDLSDLELMLGGGERTQLALPSTQKVGRNDFCPCGSGKKFKKCCLDKDAREAALPPGARVVERNGQRLLVSQGVSQSDIDLAATHFEAKTNGRGFAQQIADFAAPLMDEAGGNLNGLKAGFHLGTVLWNISLCKDDGAQEQMISDLVRATKPTGDDEKEFRALVVQMVARHKSMFPELHR